MNVSQLDDLGDTRRRFETNKLRLVLSKIPRLSGVEYLFKEFYTAAPAPSTAAPGAYVEPTGKRAKASPRGGRPPELFRAGGAWRTQPPVRRPRTPRDQDRRTGDDTPE